MDRASESSHARAGGATARRAPLGRQQPKGRHLELVSQPGEDHWRIHDIKPLVGLRFAELVTVVLAVALASAGCQNQPGGSSGSAGIVLEEMRFTPNRIDAKVGVPLTVTVTNRGTERHDINFESIHMPGLAGVESILAQGETRTIKLLFDAPGTHTFICTLPGHAAAGMTGAVFVTP